MDLSLQRWEGATPNERGSLAKRLAKQLPSGFTFDAVRLCRLGERQHHVAMFRQGDACFALIPGDEVSLGYDAGRAWHPSPDELESWESTAEEYSIGVTLQAYIAEVTLRPRRTTLAPLLIETAATELGWQAVAIDDPEVREILRKNKVSKQVEVVRGDVSTRVTRGADGSVVAERSLSLTHADLAARLRASGFRFPTSDEWEYACGGGAPTLFRWGDHAPCDRYPTDVSPPEANRRRRRALSAGKLEHPIGGFASDWDRHRQPNAFGLLIASDPYKCELVNEVGTTRGGDGGCAICGGTGFFAGWLTLATAYFEEHSCRHDLAEPIAQGYTVGRRVLEL